MISLIFIYSLQHVLEIVFFPIYYLLIYTFLFVDIVILGDILGLTMHRIQCFSPIIGISMFLAMCSYPPLLMAWYSTQFTLFGFSALYDTACATGYYVEGLFYAIKSYFLSFGAYSYTKMSSFFSDIHTYVTSFTYESSYQYLFGSNEYEKKPSFHYYNSEDNKHSSKRDGSKQENQEGFMPGGRI